MSVHIKIVDVGKSAKFPQKCSPGQLIITKFMEEGERFSEFNA